MALSLGRRLFLAAIGTLALARAEAQTAAPTVKQGESVLLATEGVVEVLRAGTTTWTPGRPNQALRPGDQIRTGPRSRAEIRLSNLAVMPVADSSVLTIEGSAAGGGPPSLNFQKGSFNILSRDRPLQFRGRLTSGATRGTEFHVRISETNETYTVFEGGLDLGAGAEAGKPTPVGPNQQATAEPGKPVRVAAGVEAVNVMQWVLYYPAVLDTADLEFSASEQSELAASLAAYRDGAVPEALALYPAGRTPGSDAERIYLAALCLGAGGVAEAEQNLALLKSDGGASTQARLANALRTLVAAVKFQAKPAGAAAQPATASEWLAESYYQQSLSKLPEALRAARESLAKDPKFALAHARVAELEFGFGRTKEALAELDQAIALSPRLAPALATKGYVLAARGKVAEAIKMFDQAIALDGMLGGAWLGRGLCRIRQGEGEAGREDLQVAAAQEPQRAVFRSYLGKAFANQGDYGRATKEFDRSKELDAHDPTSWLYSALANQGENRVNDAVRDLERSQELNDNRGVFRSQLLLDQDRAVRSANLAGIYQDAGMFDVSVREASRALNSDYANYSAHLFLANSYIALADPRQVNLRYETPAAGEYLIGNLLAPAGAGLLSPNISQQEYSRLFEKNHFGFVSSTDYSSRGDWHQNSSQYGRTDHFSYALEVVHRSENGQRVNADTELNAFDARFKFQLTPSDGVLLETLFTDNDSGDVTQSYSNRGSAARLKERQEPILLAGYHHQWSPESHTIFMAGRLTDTARFTNPNQPVTLLTRGPYGEVDYTAQPVPPVAPWEYRNDLEIYTTELQQIWQGERHTLIGGARYQNGVFDTRSKLGDSTATQIGTDTAIFSPFPPGFPPFLVNTPAVDQDLSQDFQRLSFYGYETWRVLDPLRVTGGVSYDRLDFPSNHRDAPILDREESRDRVSPKVGLVWDATKRTTVRGSFTRSLGGASLDQSFTIEPTQVGGFNQAYRSLISESVAGPQSSPDMETIALGLDHKFPTGTYFGIEKQWLDSQVRRTIGSFDLNLPPATPAFTRQELDYNEGDILVTLNQLLGEYFAVGARYRLSDAKLTLRLPEIPASVSAVSQTEAGSTLHQADVYLLFNHSTGFFAQFDSIWSGQSNREALAALPGADFWQHNVAAGYRFCHRAAEVRLGLLNLTSEDYRLYPLNFYAELPRQRTFTASFRFHF